MTRIVIKDIDFRTLEAGQRAVAKVNKDIIRWVASVARQSSR